MSWFHVLVWSNKFDIWQAIHHDQLVQILGSNLKCKIKKKLCRISIFYVNSSGLFGATFQFDEKYCEILNVSFWGFIPSNQQVFVWNIPIFSLRKISRIPNVYSHISVWAIWRKILRNCTNCIFLSIYKFHLLIAMKRNGLTEKFVKDSNFCFFRQIIGLARQSVLTSYLQHFVEHTNEQQIWRVLCQLPFQKKWWRQWQRLFHSSNLLELEFAQHLWVLHDKLWKVFLAYPFGKPPLPFHLLFLRK